jgi:hypothetical protein
MSGQLHDPVALLQGESRSYSLDRRLDGSQSWSEHGGVEKNSLTLSGIEPQLEPQLHYPATKSHFLTVHIRQETVPCAV